MFIIWNVLVYIFIYIVHEIRLFQLFRANGACQDLAVVVRGTFQCPTDRFDGLDKLSVVVYVSVYNSFRCRVQTYILRGRCFVIGTRRKVTLILSPPTRDTIVRSRYHDSAGGGPTAAHGAWHIVPVIMTERVRIVLGSVHERITSDVG